MEILFITHKYPPSIGGMQKHSYELATRLTQYAKVHTIIYHEGTSRILFFANLRRKIKKVLQEHPNISLIYLNDALMSAFTIWLKEYTTVPVVASFHGLDLVFPSRFYQQKIVPRFRALDGIIAVSQPTADECLKRGFQEKKLYPIKNGIDHEMVHKVKNPDYLKILEAKTGKKLAGKKLLLTMGRPVKRKGFCWFIKNVLPRLDDDTILLLIGPAGNTDPLANALLSSLPISVRHKIELSMGMGSDGFELKKMLKDPIYQDRLLHLGRLPFEDIIQTISVSDLFIVPNIKVEGDFEGFGLVALEAAICGTPVVASKIDGLKDAIIDGENGYLVPPKNPHAWAEKIKQLLQNKPQLDSFGQKAQAYTLAQYDWEKMVKEYYEVFETVVKQHRA